MDSSFESNILAMRNTMIEDYRNNISTQPGVEVETLKIKAQEVKEHKLKFQECHELKTINFMMNRKKKIQDTKSEDAVLETDPNEKLPTFDDFVTNSVPPKENKIWSKLTKLQKKEKILVIDGSEVFKTGRAQNFLLDEHVDKLYETYNNYEDVEGLAKVATIDEIRENEHNLNIPRYVEPIIEEEKITVEEALADLKKAMEESQKSEEKLLELLKKAGLYQ